MSTFVIVEEGRVFSPVTIRSDELLVGSAPECGLRLNHPSIPMALAGIRESDGKYHFLPLKNSPFSDALPTQILLNGRELLEDAVLTDGDLIAVEGCQLLVETDGDVFLLRVNYAGEQATLSDKSTKTVVSRRPGPHESHDVMGRWIKRRLWKNRRKVSRVSYLQPTPQKRQAGTEYNWLPTWDLAAQWPVKFLVLLVLLLLAGASLAFLLRPSLFGPGSISRAHTVDKSTLFPPIAGRANSGSCMNCHKATGAMDQNCANCHQSAGFQATISDAHKAAGLTCVSCHIEHKGPQLTPKTAAFDSCANCHNDQNEQNYNGRRVYQPHGGSFGYPVAEGKWIWPGLTTDALKLKPEVVATRIPEYNEQIWRRVQFHAIHLYRVKATGGIKGIKDGSLSCLSCHQDYGEKFDRETPREICGVCHNGYVDEQTKLTVIDAGKPNCTSCHVQHLYDAYRWGDLLTESAHEKRNHAIDQNYLEAVRRSAQPQ
jgi:hypothetical protein